jgi:D-alanyl-D-alanine carboxypeptidase
MTASPKTTHAQLRRCGWILSMLTLAAGCSTPATTSPDAGADAAIDTLATPCTELAPRLQAAMDARRKSPSASLTIMLPSCALTLTSGQPVPMDALFRVGSETKMYIVSAVLSFVHERSLTLDDTLDRWALPVPAASTITVRQLLNHTSGLYNYTSDPAFLNPATRATMQTPEALVALATQHPPYFAPGAGWHYSNTNYILLGMIAQKVGGKALAEILRERILAPNHLEHTFFAGGEAVGGTLVPGFDTSGADVTNLYDPSWAWSAGAMVASTADVARFVEDLYAGAVLAAPERAALTANPVETGQAGFQYGLGTVILSSSITGAAGIGYGHAGDIFGYHSLALYFPAQQLSIAVVVDSDADEVDDVFWAVLRVIVRG